MFLKNMHTTLNLHTLATILKKNETYFCEACKNRNRYNFLDFIKEIIKEALRTMTDLEFFNFLQRNTKIRFETFYKGQSYETLSCIQDRLYIYQKNKFKIKRTQMQIKEEFLFEFKAGFVIC